MIEQFMEYYAIAQEFLANNTFQEYGIFGLFINSLVSATFLPLPTEILTSALLMGGESELNVAIVLIVGSTIGGVINYSIGFGGNKLVKFFKRKKKNELVEGVPKKETKDEKKSHKLLGKMGWAGIFISSWIPFLGDLMLIGAGSKKMDFKKFLLFMVAGKIVKTVVVVLGLGALLV